MTRSIGRNEVPFADYIRTVAAGSQSSARWCFLASAAVAVIYRQRGQTGRTGNLN